MSFNGYYDPLTDTIRGCNPYTYVWFHERRHQKQFNKIHSLAKINNWLHIYTYAFSSAFLGATILKLIPFNFALLAMGFSVLPYSLLNLLLEVDAIIFGTYYWLKYKKAISQDY